MLRNLPCRTVALIEGDATQCASFVAMACETVRAMDHVLIGLLNRGRAPGSAAQINRVADRLDIEAAMMVGGYAACVAAGSPNNRGLDDGQRRRRHHFHSRRRFEGGLLTNLFAPMARSAVATMTMTTTKLTIPLKA